MGESIAKAAAADQTSNIQTQLSRMQLVLESFQWLSIRCLDIKDILLFSQKIYVARNLVEEEGGRCMLQFESSPFSAADNSAEYRSVIDPKVSSEIRYFYALFNLLPVLLKPFLDEFRFPNIFSVTSRPKEAILWHNSAEYRPVVALGESATEKSYSI